MQGEIEAEELARALGSTRDQVRRWHKAGLLPEPTRNWPGDGGSRTYYPASALPQGLALVGHLNRKRSLKQSGWRLWVDGFRIHERYWLEPLRDCSRACDVEIRSLRSLLDGDDEEKLDLLVDGLLKCRTKHGVFRRIRKALGPERFRSWIVRILEIAAGLTNDRTHRGRRDADFLRDVRTDDLGLGLRHARTDHFPGDAPLLSGDYSPVLKSVSDSFAGISFEERLGTFSPQELQEAASEARTLLRIFGALNRGLSALFGKGWFGLQRVAEFDEQSDLKLDLTIVLFWAVYRRSSGVRDRARDLIRTAAEMNPVPLPTRPRRTHAVFPHESWAIDSADA
jgi:hypothetical protein